MSFLKYFLLLNLLLLLSCDNGKSRGADKSDQKRQHEDSLQVEKNTYLPQSTDAQTANNLKVFLKNYTAEDAEFLQPADKKFQFYKTDLNKDGNEEIFVRLMGPYFCGSGGCTFFLLDKYGEQITKFTVTRAPFFKEPSLVNGWSLLLVKDDGAFKELRFEDGSYPSNPSILPKAPYDAPSGHAEVIFGEGQYQCQTHEF